MAEKKNLIDAVILAARKGDEELENLWERLSKEERKYLDTLLLRLEVQNPPPSNEPISVAQDILRLLGDLPTEEY